MKTSRQQTAEILQRELALESQRDADEMDLMVALDQAEAERAAILADDQDAEYRSQIILQNRP